MTSVQCFMDFTNSNDSLVTFPGSVCEYFNENCFLYKHIQGFKLCCYSIFKNLELGFKTQTVPPNLFRFVLLLKLIRPSKMLIWNLNPVLIIKKMVMMQTHAHCPSIILCTGLNYTHFSSFCKFQDLALVIFDRVLSNK